VRTVSAISLTAEIAVVTKDPKAIWIIALYYPAIEPQSASVNSSESGAIIIDVVYSQKAAIGLAAT
jgi:hypothetical protein